MLDEITYPFNNINGTTVDVIEWIGNFIQHFKFGMGEWFDLIIMGICTYGYMYLFMKFIHASKSGPRMGISIVCLGPFY